MDFRERVATMRQSASWTGRRAIELLGPIFRPRHFIFPIVLAVHIAIICTQPAFVTLLFIRYFRLALHLIGNLIYQAPVTPRQDRYLTTSDATVIVPTVNPNDPDFDECISSILAEKPRTLLIVTVGADKKQLCDDMMDGYRPRFPDTRIGVAATAMPNKRRQLAHAIRRVDTPITVIADDHVFWPPGYLAAIVEPFHDERVGLVGTNKVVRRPTPGRFGLQSITNLLGCLYLERHNFELRGSSAIPGDGGVFVISGRTAAHRTAVIQDPAFLAAFVDERFLFGRLGPLNADDDNFITRWYVAHDKQIRFVARAEATAMETTLGTYPKFRDQLLRWARTTWRSNGATLLRGGTNVWFGQGFSVFAIYLASFVNFALLWDPLLIWTLTLMPVYESHRELSMGLLCGWIIAMCILFSYVHSIIKLWSLVTFWDCVWGGRDLSAVGGNQAANAEGLGEFSFREAN